MNEKAPTHTSPLIYSSLSKLMVHVSLRNPYASLCSVCSSSPLRSTSIHRKRTSTVQVILTFYLSIAILLVPSVRTIIGETMRDIRPSPDINRKIEESKLNLSVPHLRFPDHHPDRNQKIEGSKNRRIPN
jgi:hypothetical protein